ncbi:MAG: pentapeptide repeat-containing protein, partial [Cyanobacteria bacterium J06643_5]
MDSKLPKNQDFETHGGNYCEPNQSSYIQDNSVNTFNHDDNDVSKIAQEQLVFVLSGSVHEINPVRLRIIQTHLHKISGDTKLTVSVIEQGSIKIEGSILSLEKLQELFKEGMLLEILGIPIEYVYFLNNDESKQENQENQESSLVRDILENGAFGKDLTGSDLKGVNLRNADLSGSDLSGANLEGANLEGANLLYANLKGTIIDSTTKLDDKWLIVW